MFLRAVNVKSGGFTSKMVSFNSWLYNHIFASQGKLGSPSPSLPITTALQALFWHEASLQSHLNPWKFSSWFQWELDQTLLGQELPKALSYIPPMLPFPWYLQAKSKMFIKVELHGQKTEEQMARKHGVSQTQMIKSQLDVATSSEVSEGRQQLWVWYRGPRGPLCKNLTNQSVFHTHSFNFLVTQTIFYSSLILWACIIVSFYQ